MRMAVAQSVVKNIALINIAPIEPEERWEDWAIDGFDGMGVSELETFEGCSSLTAGELPVARYRFLQNISNSQMMSGPRSWV